MYIFQLKFVYKECISSQKRLIDDLRRPNLFVVILLVNNHMILTFFLLLRCIVSCANRQTLFCLVNDADGHARLSTAYSLIQPRAYTIQDMTDLAYRRYTPVRPYQRGRRAP